MIVMQSALTLDCDVQMQSVLALSLCLLLVVMQSVSEVEVAATERKELKREQGLENRRE